MTAPTPASDSTLLVYSMHRQWLEAAARGPQSPVVVPPVNFGKDHISTLLYIESCVVDNRGRLDCRKMRPDGDKYPTRARRPESGESYDVTGHSDWDCLRDLVTCGYVEPHPEAIDAYGRLAPPLGYVKVPFLTHRVKLTAAGMDAATAVRRDRAERGAAT